MRAIEKMPKCVVHHRIRCIFVPGIDRRVSLAEYNRAIRAAKANPDAEFKTGLTCWWPCTGREIMSQFMRGVHERINNRVPYVLRGC